MSLSERARLLSPASSLFCALPVSEQICRSACARRACVCTSLPLRRGFVTVALLMSATIKTPCGAQRSKRQHSDSTHLDPTAHRASPCERVDERRGGGKGRGSGSGGAGVHAREETDARSGTLESGRNESKSGNRQGPSQLHAGAQTLYTPTVPLHIRACRRFLPPNRK